MLRQSSSRKLSQAFSRNRAILLVRALFAAGFLLSAAAVSYAQFPPPVKPLTSPGQFGRRSMLPEPGPMSGVFSFVEPLSDVNSNVVKGVPFSATVIRETVQRLADGNVINHKSVGTFARDSEGRTSREITLENIGPWASAGKPPVLVFINDPVARKIYVLDENRKTVSEITSSKNANLRSAMRTRRWREFQSDVQKYSLGDKTMDGLQVQGTRIVRTIPAGQIGNEKPIVISTVRWYSPELQTTILLKRTDPRFGTNTFELTNINLSQPPSSLFEIPPGYTVRHEKGFRGMARPRPGPDPDFP
jgi:hypothetical protein